MQSATSSKVWSRLPIELTREIILYLASNDLKTACSLRLISRFTNVWVLPLLFRTLTFTSVEHITRFAATLLPKRKLHIPALKTTLHHFPRALSSYNIGSLAFAVNTRLPSVEVALANVAPAFSRLKNLAITSQNLSSNAHWLRKHPIHPINMMILHFGSPHPVNYRDPVFKCVTHLYTSTLEGHRDSFVTDVPQLTHLAVHTRLHHSSAVMLTIVNNLLHLMEAAPQLQLLVFVLDDDDGESSALEEWMCALEPCMNDKRFIVLPFLRHPRVEWESILQGVNDVWDRALAWHALRKQGDPCEIISYRNSMLSQLRKETKNLRKMRYDVDWEIDLVQREGYIPHEDITEKLYTRTRFPNFITYP